MVVCVSLFNVVPSTIFLDADSDGGGACAFTGDDAAEAGGAFLTFLRAVCLVLAMRCNDRKKIMKGSAHELDLDLFFEVEEGIPCIV
jgi:hypothetical protein